MIGPFRGKYEFLSNFYLASMTFKGMTFRCAEAAFQAQKNTSPAYQAQFQTALPRSAKRLGSLAPLRPDWEAVKLNVMGQVLVAKFSDPTLKMLLRKTGTETLVEVNSWSDTFWGAVPSPITLTNQEDYYVNEVGETFKGLNHLGKLLEKVRLNLVMEISSEIMSPFVSLIQEHQQRVESKMRKIQSLKKIRTIYPTNPTTDQHFSFEKEADPGPRPRTWCDHIRWAKEKKPASILAALQWEVLTIGSDGIQEVQKKKPGSPLNRGHGWFFTGENGLVKVDPQWNVCPICQVSRPVSLVKPGEEE